MRANPKQTLKSNGIQQTKTIAEWWAIGSKLMASRDPYDREVGFSIHSKVAFAGKADHEPLTIGLTAGAMRRVIVL